LSEAIIALSMRGLLIAENAGAGNDILHSAALSQGHELTG
jgi:hypothetical protein